jgi:hypothetical protein
MRFSALALGSLALVDFTVGLDTKPADSSSVSIPIETSSHTTKNPSVTKTTSSSSARASHRHRAPTQHLHDGCCSSRRHFNLTDGPLDRPLRLWLHCREASFPDQRLH